MALAQRGYINGHVDVFDSQGHPMRKSTNAALLEHSLTDNARRARLITGRIHVSTLARCLGYRTVVGEPRAAITRTRAVSLTITLICDFD